MFASDIVVGVRRGLVWLGANIHAPPNTPLLVRWQPERAARRGADPEPLELGGVRVAPASHGFATVSLAAPGAWGCPIGANSQGVAIGSSPVTVSEPLGRAGLRGTELVRLGLERGPSARGALDVIVELLERHGQRGDGRDDGPGARQSCSMLVADPGEAYLLETAGRRWAVDRVTTSRALSGALSIPGFADRHGDWLHAATTRAAARAGRVTRRSAGLRRTGELLGLLRDHGEAARTPLRDWLQLQGSCRHASPRLPEQTAGAWLSELGPAARHWTTASSSPCVALFKPVGTAEPLELRAPAEGLADAESLWWRHERWCRALARDPSWFTAARVAERDGAELGFAQSSPSSAEAFALGDALLRRWLTEIEAERGRDARSWLERRYWRALDRGAGLPSS